MRKIVEYVRQDMRAIRAFWSGLDTKTRRKKVAHVSILAYILGACLTHGATHTDVGFFILALLFELE